MKASDVADALIEVPVVTSFSKLGYALRSRLDHWRPLDEYDLGGRAVVLTGATSGLGRAAAVQFAQCGASLVVVGRDPQRNAAVVDDLRAATGNASVRAFAADLGNFDDVHALAVDVLEHDDRLDVLIHNAGALAPERSEAPDGTESTVASQVVGPFLLTALLLDRLVETGGARVLTMSSGGMYTAPLSVDELEMPADGYKGATQYARAKRAQVTLNELWARRLGSAVHFHAVHPGWADTPGLDASLPRFAQVMGPLLRTAAEGADTLVWLAADDAALQTNGGFWLDRRRRSVHKLPATRRADTESERTALWNWVATTAGLDPVTLHPAPSP